jgi:hypothetical protein
LEITVIKKTILRPGDVLLYKPKSVFHISAWFITWAQNVIGKNPISGAKYCHVALVDSDTDYILESKWPKSHRVKLDWNKLDKAYDIELWRVREVTQSQIDKILEWASANLGEWYDLGLFIWGLFDMKHMEVCSTFVEKSLQNAGLALVPKKIIAGNKEFLTPDEIAAQPFLKRIV